MANRSQRSPILTALILCAPVIFSITAAHASDATAAVPDCNLPTVPTAKSCAPGEQKAFEKYLRDLIINASRNGKLLPVVSYTGYNDSPGAPSGVDTDAAARAALISKALFASIQDPANAADQAAGVVFNDRRRRESFSYLHACEDSPNQIKDAERDPTCPEPMLYPIYSQSADMGVRRVYRSELPAAEAAQAFVRTQLIPSDMHNVWICRNGQCGGSSVNEKQAATLTIPVTPATEATPRYTELLDSTQLTKEKQKLVGYPIMRNDYHVAVIEKNVCGGKVYVVPQFLEWSEYGMSRATAITLTVDLGPNRSLLIGSADAQAYQHDPNIQGAEISKTGSYMLYSAMHLKKELKPLVVDQGSLLYRKSLKVNETIVAGKAVPVAPDAAAAASAESGGICRIKGVMPSGTATDLGLQLQQIARAARDL